MDSESERLVRIASAFRAANDRIRDSALRLKFEDDQRVPLLCECGDSDCKATVMITLAAYASIREDPRRFLVIVDHENAALDLIVEDGAGRDYVVVRKVGKAAIKAGQLAVGSRAGRERA